MGPQVIMMFDLNKLYNFYTFSLNGAFQGMVFGACNSRYEQLLPRSYNAQCCQFGNVGWKWCSVYNGPT